MTRPLAVLRPEPGNAATSARIEALGRTALRLPLFAVQPVTWTPPDLDQFDGVLLTSANALRHGGPGLAKLTSLPVFAVGEATAAAADAAGFAIAATGGSDAAEIVARADGARLLHLAGREHRAMPGVATIVVYASDPVEIDASRLAGSVALVHSPRAGARLAALVDPATVRLAAISPAAAAAAGAGWAAMAIAARPADDALIAAARGLAD